MTDEDIKDKYNNHYTPGSNFIQCAKANPETENWDAALIKLSEIKEITKNDCTPNKKGCIFYTYKDRWYICSLSPRDLADVIDQYYAINKIKPKDYV